MMIEYIHTCWLQISSWVSQISLSFNMHSYWTFHHLCTLKCIDSCYCQCRKFRSMPEHEEILFFFTEVNQLDIDLLFKANVDHDGHCWNLERCVIGVFKMANITIPFTNIVLQIRVCASICKTVTKQQFCLARLNFFLPFSFTFSTLPLSEHVEL